VLAKSPMAATRRSLAARFCASTGQRRQSRARVCRGGRVRFPGSRPQQSTVPAIPCAPHARGRDRFSPEMQAAPREAPTLARLTAATCCLARQPFQQSRHLHRVPVTATARRGNVPLVECLGNGVQACYPARPQLRNDGRKVGRRSICARYTGFIGDALGAVAHMATSWHSGSLPIRPLNLLQPGCSRRGSQLILDRPALSGPASELPHRRPAALRSDRFQSVLPAL
jgi:hypothetical protein